MNKKIFLVSAVLALLSAGCAHVEPTQRGTLARTDMQFDFDVAQTKLREHTFASKEAASGGRATGGGGCGCT